MKAKEYYAQIKDCSTHEELVSKTSDIFLSLLNGMQDLIKVRHISSYSGVKTVVLEADDKWNALCRLVNQNGGICDAAFKEDGYYSMLTVYYPDISKYLEDRYKKQDANIIESS